MAARSAAWTFCEDAQPGCVFLPFFLLARVKNEVIHRRAEVDIEGLDNKHSHVRWPLPTWVRSCVPSPLLEWLLLCLWVNRPPWNVGACVRVADLAGRCLLCSEGWSTAHVLRDCGGRREEQRRLWGIVTHEGGGGGHTELVLSVGRSAGASASSSRRLLGGLVGFLKEVYHLG